MLKDGTLLISTARASIIEENALVEVLRSGRINAILDVYENEPLEENHSLRTRQNVWLFAHIAAYSGYWKKRLAYQRMIPR